MYSRQSTIVTFHGPTNNRGPRYTARNAAGSRTVDQADDMDAAHNAVVAASGLLVKLGRTGRYTLGTLPDGRHVVTEIHPDTSFTVGNPPPVGPVFLAQYIGADNDTNGNPRRGWIVTRLDQTVAPTWIEEGYGNFPWRAFAEKLGMNIGADVPWYDVRDRVRPFVVETGRLHVTPAEYKESRKLARFCANGE